MNQKSERQAGRRQWSVGALVWLIFRILVAWLNLYFIVFSVTLMIMDAYPYFRATNEPAPYNVDLCTAHIYFAVCIGVSVLYFFSYKSKKAFHALIAVNLLGAGLYIVTTLSTTANAIIYRVVLFALIPTVLTAITALLTHKKT